MDIFRHLNWHFEKCEHSCRSMDRIAAEWASKNRTLSLPARNDSSLADDVVGGLAGAAGGGTPSEEDWGERPPVGGDAVSTLQKFLKFRLGRTAQPALLYSYAIATDSCRWSACVRDIQVAGDTQRVFGTRTS